MTAILSGIDVWGGSAVTSWDTIKNHCADSFGADLMGWAVVKCTEGCGRDPGYVRNLDGANKVGLLTGDYHVLSFGSDYKAQIDNYLKCRGQTDLPLSLDVESSPSLAPSIRATQCINALKYAEDKTGVRPDFYSYPGYIFELTRGAPSFDWASYRLWIAHYFQPRINRDTNKKIWLYGQGPTVPPPWKDWLIWQFAGDANGFKCPGMNGYADMSIYRGCYDDFKREFGLSVALPTASGESGQIPASS